MKNRIRIKNRKASFDYFFLQEYTAGIQLFGSEVKSIKAGKVNLADSFCYFKSDELFLKGAIVTEGSTSYTHDPHREKKLLMKRKELDKLQRSMEKGTTVVVKQIFEDERGLIKIEIALAKGKKNYDKRETIKQRDIERDLKKDLVNK